VVKAALPFSVVANARSGVDSIRISIEGPPFTAESDANGLFLVRGNFAGPANLLFQRPEDGLIARLRINVPAGGILTLNNVRIDARRTDTDSRTLDFRGLVAGTNCPAGTIALVSQRRPRDGNIYSVRVPGSQLRDQTGTEVRCEDLRGGAGVTCHGNVSDDDETSIEEADVEVDGDDSGSGGDGGDNSGPGGGDDGGSSSGSTSSDSSSGPGGGD
jgi:hypothetical protein